MAASPELARREVAPIEELLVAEANGEGNDLDAELGGEGLREVTGAVGDHPNRHGDGRVAGGGPALG